MGDTGGAADSSDGHQHQVRFPEDDGDLATVLCEIPSREDLTQEEQNELFFTRLDYQQSRSAAKIVSKESERYGFSKNLDEVYAEKNKEAQERLNVWVARGHSRRGLERWANRDHGDKRQQDQFQAIMAVLRAQDDMLAERKKVDPEQLRKVSYKATKIARHFARMMGKADCYAMTEDAEKIDKETVTLHDSMSAMSFKDDDTRSITTVEKQEDMRYDNPIETIGDSQHRKRVKSLRRALFGGKSSKRSSNSSGGGDKGETNSTSSSKTSSSTAKTARVSRVA